MSLHVTNPELEAQLAAQRRNSTIASIIVGLLLMTLMALIFWLIGIKIFSKKTEPIVAYSADEVSEEVVEKVKVTNSVKKTPSSPSSSAVKVIAAAATSDFSVPTPEVAVDSLSVDFGESEGFGDGWGGGAGGGFGSGGGGGKFSFMNSKMSGERVCFVMDYSASMGGARIKLLKTELEKTIAALPDGIEYQMIFFAGPAWIAGSDVASARNSSNVTFEGKSYKWKGQGAHSWEQVGRKQPVNWMKSNEVTREDSLKAIRETQLVYGTDWVSPLEMALDMSPKPELIVFLTDGSSGADSMDKAKKLGNRAKTRKIRVNTIALMEPSTRDAMGELAKRSGGEFSMIDKDGKKVKQKVDNGGGFKKRDDK